MSVPKINRAGMYRDEVVGSIHSLSSMSTYHLYNCTHLVLLAALAIYSFSTSLLPEFLKGTVADEPGPVDQFRGQDGPM